MPGSDGTIISSVTSCGDWANAPVVIVNATAPIIIDVAFMSVASSWCAQSIDAHHTAREGQIPWIQPKEQRIFRRTVRLGGGSPPIHPRNSRPSANSLRGPQQQIWVSLNQRIFLPDQGKPRKRWISACPGESLART